MFLRLWSVWYIFLNLHLPACSLKILQLDSDVVNCSQGLSKCTMNEDVYTPEDTVKNLTFKSDFKLCRRKKTEYSACLLVEIEFTDLWNGQVEDENSGLDAEEEETTSERSSVMVCYQLINSIVPSCKRVRFTIDHNNLTHQTPFKVSVWFTNIQFKSHVNVYTNQQIIEKTQVLVAPSLNQVCNDKELRAHISLCSGPRVSAELKETQVKLHIHSSSSPALCVQYEDDGQCKGLNQTSIPLYSLAPCTCLQVYDKNDESSKPKHFQSCPFKQKDFLPHSLRNLKENISVDVSLSRRSDGIRTLLWNLTAPCRLDGEVLLCDAIDSCRGEKNPQRKFSNLTGWTQTSQELWKRQAAFENIEERISQCVMLKVQLMKEELMFGPFCSVETGRWRWTLLGVGAILLICLTALIVYCLHDYVKKWVWIWHHGGFVKISRRGRVLLLSPPDMDGNVSESISQLGTQLCSEGFDVSVDQWSRREQCTMGPLPWLHSKLLEMDSVGDRVLLVCTQKASEKAAEFSSLNMVGDNPYSDLFTAALSLIQAHKKLGRAAERFVLVKFNPQKQWRGSDKGLPALLQGLPLFQLPVQIQALLAELTVNGKPGSSKWTNWK